MCCEHKKLWKGSDRTIPKLEFKECKRDMQREESLQATLYCIDFILFIKTYGSHGLRLQKHLKQGNKTIPSSFFEASRGLESVAIVGLLL